MKHDTIPGITITLSENPLHSKVTMTESAKREFIYRFALKQMEDMMWEAHFRTNENANSTNSEKPAEAFKMFIDFEGHDKYPENSFQFWEAFAMKHGLQYQLDALNEEHGGDCTAVACSCIRCWAESLAGIDTCPGGKHLNAKISALFARPTTDPQLIAFKEAQNKKSAEYWDTVKREKPEYWRELQERWAQERVVFDAFMAEHRRKYAEQEATKSLEKTLL